MDLFATQRPLLTVSELVRELRSATENRFGWVRVCGEISDWKTAASGHAYFVLRDEQSQLPAVMFRAALEKLPLKAAAGDQVECLGRPTVYERRGQLQLVVEWMMPRGAGLAALKLLTLKKKLQEEGLFDPARKRPLPFFPSRVGVVTSPLGAAVRDIVKILHQRMPSVEVVVSPCLVQGQQAPASIMAALRLLIENTNCQVIIIGRGGGASEDLSAFNDEQLVRAVTACPVPVVSAVGHEVDLVLCDLAADARAPTPTAAAQLVVPDRRELAGRWQTMRKLAARALSERLAASRRRLAAFRQRLGDPRLLLAGYRLRLDDNHRLLATRLPGLISDHRRQMSAAGFRLRKASPQQLVHRNRRRLLETGHRALWTARQRLETGKNFWHEKCGRMAGLDPRAVLARGFAQVCDRQRRVLRDSREILIGQHILVRLWRGRLQAEVEYTWPDEDKET